MKYQEFKKSINKPYFSILDISLKRLNVFRYQLSSWRKNGYIGRLKRGLYFFIDEKDKMIPEEVAFLLREPSYLSLEFMLSRYGLIPEMVYARTSVTTKTTVKFSNDFGNFTYRQVHPRLFFGYEPVELPSGKYLAADPEKALLDFLYLNLDKINDRRDLDGLRINCEELKRIVSRKKMNTYLKEFKIKKMEHLVKILFEKIC